jgi:hypothetical protein
MFSHAPYERSAVSFGEDVRPILPKSLSRLGFAETLGSRGEAKIELSDGQTVGLVRGILSVDLHALAA